MSSLEPIVNLLALLTALSVIVERITNVMKLNNPTLRLRKEAAAEERERERGIQFRSVVVGIAVSLLLKSDMFSILAHLDAPWQTVGWVRLEGATWIQSPALSSVGAACYAVGGSIITGLGLAFGSKFWHDVLETVFEIRSIARSRVRSGNGGGNG